MPSQNALVLALDIGSSSLRSALFTSAGQRLIASSAARKYSVQYNRDGAAELDPIALLRAARSCARETLRHANKPVGAVAGSAIWHSLLGLNRDGDPLTPIFTWADSRSAPDASDLRRELSERRIQLRTGCMLRAPYWPAKLRWLRRTDRAAFRRVASWTSPGTWIFARLFGANATSHSMASGTGLYNLTRAAWDPELCAMCDLRIEQLGEIRDRCLTSDRAVFPTLGDGAASNLGSGADRPNQFAINIGTSAAVRVVRRKQQAGPIAPGLFKYFVDEERVLVGGAISNAGNLHQWCLRELQVRSDKDAEAALDRDAAARDELAILPFLVDERAPTWPDDLSGTISGLRFTTSGCDVLRAATTSSFYRLAEILDRLTPAASAEIIVSGGILHSPRSLSILADCLGRDIRVCREMESSLRGAAIHALENLGYKPKPLRAGKIIRYRKRLSAQHRARRERQMQLERLLSREATRPRADRRSRPAGKRS